MTATLHQHVHLVFSPRHAHQMALVHSLRLRIYRAARRHELPTGLIGSIHRHIDALAQAVRSGNRLAMRAAKQAILQDVWGYRLRAMDGAAKGAPETAEPCPTSARAVLGALAFDLAFLFTRRACGA
jgi:hypothetical protein